MEADKVDKFLLANESKFLIMKFLSIDCSTFLLKKRRF